MSTAVAEVEDDKDEGYEDIDPNCCCTCLCCDGIFGGNEDTELEILAEVEAGVGANRSSRPDKEDDASVFEAACADLKSGLTPEDTLMLYDEPAAFEMSAEDDTELNKSSKLSSKLATCPFDEF